MVVGIGIDSTEIYRMKKAVTSQSFLTRVFTEKEISLYQKRNSNPSVLAGNFAVKEAVAKALQTGFVGFWPKDVEVLRTETGAPTIVLHGKAKAIAEGMHIAHFHVSITNTKQLATAFVVAQSATH